MNRMLTTLMVVLIIACACSSPKSESVVDSTGVAADAVAPDTVALEASASALPIEADAEVGSGGLNSDGEYVITSEQSYIYAPFAFLLDSAAIMEILGEDATIEANYTPSAEDDEGRYEAYTFYRVKYGETSMSFYSYSGKHFADIKTPLLPMKYEIVVGMEKGVFLEKMSLSGEEAENADVFTINDDYGSMSFYFSEGKMTRVYVSYEEGT
jgi:hypothetical protein